MYSNEEGAFVARKENGELASWGNPGYGGSGVRQAQHDHFYFLDRYMFLISQSRACHAVLPFRNPSDIQKLLHGPPRAIFTASGVGGFRDSMLPIGPTKSSMMMRPIVQCTSPAGPDDRWLGRCGPDQPRVCSDPPGRIAALLGQHCERWAGSCRRHRLRGHILDPRCGYRRPGERHSGRLGLERPRQRGAVWRRRSLRSFIVTILGPGQPLSSPSHAALGL